MKQQRLIMQKRFAGWSLVLAAALAALVGIAWLLNGRRADTGKPAAVVMAYSPFESTALV